MVCSHYHSFQSTLVIILGFSDVCGQIPTEVGMVVGSLKRPLFIYWKSLLHFVK